ncbi:MAG: type II secretion system protein [Candidatus Moraniibacteriota bacterium]
MYHEQVKSEKLKVKKIGLGKSFTLIEVIVVMGVMGLIIGGLLVSMRQIIEGEMLLKRMQAVEEESRFIMDLFAQDSQYSELDDTYKPSTDSDIFTYLIRYILVEKKGEISGTTNNRAEYLSYHQDNISGRQYFLMRNITGDAEDLSVTLNNTPLASRPVFRIRRLASPEGAENYMITISLTFWVENRDNPVLVPIQTSVVSRTFEI